MAAASFTEADWRDMRTFAWLTLTYHMHRLLTVATTITWKLSANSSRIWRARKTTPKPSRREGQTTTAARS